MTQQTTFQIPYYPISRHKDIMHTLLKYDGVLHIDYHKVEQQVSSAVKTKYIEITVKFNDKLIDIQEIDDIVRIGLRKL